jgi:hypothetical protein
MLKANKCRIHYTTLVIFIEKKRYMFLLFVFNEESAISFVLSEKRIESFFVNNMFYINDSVKEMWIFFFIQEFDNNNINRFQSCSFLLYIKEKCFFFKLLEYKIPFYKLTKQTVIFFSFHWSARTFTLNLLLPFIKK